MPSQIYSKGNFVIKVARGQYVVENVKFSFDNGESRHSHFYFNKGNKKYKLNKAKRVIYYAINRTIPRKCDLRFLGSLIRLTGDNEFRKKVSIIKRSRERKGEKEKYINIQKGGVGNRCY